MGQSIIYLKADIKWRMSNSCPRTPIEQATWTNRQPVRDTITSTTPFFNRGRSFYWNTFWTGAAAGALVGGLDWGAEKLAENYRAYCSLIKVSNESI